MAVTSAATSHLVDVERLDRIDILGPTIQFLTGPTDTDAPCIMRGTIPPGVPVPLHMHADPETFLMMSGRAEGLSMDSTGCDWVALAPGNVFHVPGGAKHGFRNPGPEPAVMIIVSTSRIGRFFQEVGTPIAVGGAPASPPARETIERFLRVSARYGYWNASPEENARIGIVLPM